MEQVRRHQMDSLLVQQILRVFQGVLVAELKFLVVEPDRGLRFIEPVFGEIMFGGGELGLALCGGELQQVVDVERVAARMQGPDQQPLPVAGFLQHDLLLWCVHQSHPCDRSGIERGERRAFRLVLFARFEHDDQHEGCDQRH